MRNLSSAANVRRRGRSKSSGDAAAGAETIVGLRPSSLSAPAAARVLAVFDLKHNHWMFSSYAPKGKLPAGVCLIIIGTAGLALASSETFAAGPMIAPGALATTSVGSAEASVEKTVVVVRRRAVVRRPVVRRHVVVRRRFVRQRALPTGSLRLDLDGPLCGPWAPSRHGRLTRAASAIGMTLGRSAHEASLP